MDIKASTLANANWEEAGTLSTRNTSKHGPSKGQRGVKRLYNRAAKHAAKSRSLKERLAEVQDEAAAK